MTTRAKQKNTEADIKLHQCLNSIPPQSFLMLAGAGSGKTTSLIKGLSEILEKHGERLKLRKQRVACITYTEIAAGEIWADVGNNPLVHVSTIHSFLWSLVRSFQSDISIWVKRRLEEKIIELQETAANFGSRVQQRTRDKNQSDIVRYKEQLSEIGKVHSYSYGTGSDYARGLLGHDDIIKMVPQLLCERPLFRTLLAQQYPFVFVDESQDTTENVVTGLKAVAEQCKNNFCIGFFGDPMQKIYPTGIGTIVPSRTWVEISKTENFRCSKSVLDVANAIRRDGDSLVQTRGRMSGTDGDQVPVLGSAHFFIFSIDERRDEKIKLVRDWMARKNSDPSWSGENSEAVKLLVIVHRMAARRLGFGELYSALNDKAPEKFKNGFLDGTAWPIRPFGSFVLPLVKAIKDKDDFEVMQILRDQSPLLSKGSLVGFDVAQRLAELSKVIESISEMMRADSGSTIEDILRYLHESKVYTLDPRILSYLDLPNPTDAAIEDEQSENDDEEELSKEVSAMDAFLSCPASQFWGYYDYLNEVSPFSTQQGIKGAEFERVLVILDDDEGTHVQFSYDKYLGIKPLSDRDQANIRDGKETSVERTRRLFYVCCTRALNDLAVVLFTSDVDLAKRKITELQIFPPDCIHLEGATF